MTQTNSSTQSINDLKDLGTDHELELLKIEGERNHELEMLRLVLGTAERIMFGAFDLAKAIDQTNGRMVEALSERAPKVLELYVMAQEKVALAHFASFDKLALGLGKFILKVCELPIVGKLVELEQVRRLQ